MKQLAIISGKGGTGKTSLVSAFASLADSVVTADCDVDAADLHLILEPTILQTVKFEGGLVAQINLDECGECGECLKLCRFDAISSANACISCRIHWRPYPGRRPETARSSRPSGYQPW